MRVLLAGRACILPARANLAHVLPSATDSSPRRNDALQLVIRLGAHMQEQRWLARDILARALRLDHIACSIHPTPTHGKILPCWVELCASCCCRRDHKCAYAQRLVRHRASGERTPDAHKITSWRSGIGGCRGNLWRGSRLAWLVASQCSAFRRNCGEGTSCAGVICAYPLPFVAAAIRSAGVLDPA